jgi:hypothetical protein
LSVAKGVEDEEIIYVGMIKAKILHIITYDPGFRKRKRNPLILMNIRKL